MTKEPCKEWRQRGTMTIGKSEFGWENSVNETKSDGEREENLDDNNVQHIFLENKYNWFNFFF